jgi:hypothetical protein
MSNLGTLTRNGDNNAVELTLDGTSPMAQYNIFQNRFYGGDLFIHYKTNIPFGGWSMFNIEAVGYNYGTGQAIRCNWCCHISYGNGFYSQELSQIYPGLSANRIYNSTDGYVVIVATGGSMYFAGWSLNAYTLNPTGPFTVTILASVQTASNSNAY